MSKCNVIGERGKFCEKEDSNLSAGGNANLEVFQKNVSCENCRNSAAAFDIICPEKYFPEFLQKIVLGNIPGKYAQQIFFRIFLQKIVRYARKLFEPKVQPVIQSVSRKMWLFLPMTSIARLVPVSSSTFHHRTPTNYDDDDGDDDGDGFDDVDDYDDDDVEM